MTARCMAAVTSSGTSPYTAVRKRSPVARRPPLLVAGDPPRIGSRVLNPAGSDLMVSVLVNAAITETSTDKP